VVDLIRSIYPRCYSKKLFVVLNAYVDESGTHEGAPITLMGGLVADADTWAKFDADWLEILDYIRVPYFHASQLAAVKGIYKELAIDEVQRNYLWNRLPEVIEKHKPLAFLAGVFIKDYKSVGLFYDTAAFTSPYHFCFHNCLQHVVAWSKKNRNGEPVNFVLSEQNEYKKESLRAFYEDYKTKSLYSQQLGALSFASMVTTRPLQGADMLLYDAYVLLTQKANAPGKRFISEMVQRGALTSIGALYDLAALQRLIAGDEGFILMPGTYWKA
jgi:hypothetical protein